MQVPVQITFRDLPHSDAVKSHLEERVDKLQQFCHNIISCHIVVELSNKNQHRGNLHNTHITITVPGKELVTTRNEMEDMYLSIRSAFDDMTVQLESYVEHIQNKVKNHQTTTTMAGKIVRLFNGDGFGFIEGANGIEFYFNANHVLEPNFHKLTVGTPVHFIEGMGTDGPQAHRVKIIEETE
ncbi:MAG: ribosomal subunit interface protein [Gammaproteobacteria bacterium CG_4_10_14_0_8_um_filter_38_16]|nr:MAG: ribosomal subunit interface protein [Gammaproteobacteria bacterium CG_4_10_14_0_8_um_filter_38_16]PJA03942.1 MAG: ribosomal subunit interface protein [Gammaproteobacteria bacterium CG_4_10_14_0_2_um_filter_38_22]PJB09731.1 MAG: ribosomal subunit interface protein [Gammaproteobacteria bacterium CG_4_9_14_3_um_filter_38_9]